MSKDDERNRLGGRISRYARVSTTVGGLAAKMAGSRYFGIDFEREKHAEELKDALGNLRGPLVKIAQLMATIPEALPREYVTELQKLQANAPAMGWPFVKRRMATELGRDWQSKFDNFERKAAAAASLGQVHKALTHDGEDVACKLQYPDMQSAVAADLKQLKLVLGIYEKYDKAIQTKYIQQELGDRLQEELDYALESKHCQLYEYMLREEDGVHVPRVIPDLSTGRLLTSTWLEGQPILNFVDAPLEQRNRLALNMFRAWYVPLYFYGTIHGDPHLGNYSVQEDNSINLLDFGCVRVFPPSFVHGVIELYHALCTDDIDRAVAAYETWGFKDLSKDLIAVLNIWAKFLYGPVMEDKERVIGVPDGAIYGRETAMKVHEELRRLGGVAVPREFVFMDRAALGLGSVFIHLQAEINWHTLFNELIANFDVKKMEKRQSDALKKFDITPAH